MSSWTFFSNHGHVLVCLANDPDARLRDVAASVDLTGHDDLGGDWDLEFAIGTIDVWEQ